VVLPCRSSCMLVPVDHSISLVLIVTTAPQRTLGMS
jgi:hypothetical protein